MKVLVVGTSKGTGAACVASALARGHEVVAFARSPAKLAITNEKLSKVAGDFHDAKSVEAAISSGCNAVIVTAGAAALSEMKKKPDYFSRGTKACIDAMKKHGPKRLVVLSAFGAGDSRAGAGWLMRVVLIDGFLKRIYADHDVEEQLVRASGLEWTLARPTRLTDGPARGSYARSTTPTGKVPSSISRADVADFLVECCTTPEAIGQAISLGG